MDTKKAKEVLANAPEGATHYKETKHSKTYYKVTVDKSEPAFGDVERDYFWCKYTDTWRPSSFFNKDGAYNLSDLKAIEMNDKQYMMTQAQSDDIEQLEKSALEMSERDIPSFDEPVFVSPLDACASNEDGSDDCVYTELRHIGDRIHNISCSIEDEKLQEILGKISSTLWGIKKPESLEEKAIKLHRDFNSKIFNGNVPEDAKWENLPSDVKDSFKYIASLHNQHPPQN